jgi:hypothetical protein
VRASMKRERSEPVGASTPAAATTERGKSEPAVVTDTPSSPTTN